jgi:hypothetical protein
MAVVEIVVATGSTLTAAAAITTAKYARDIVKTVGNNEDRSKTNREVLMGDPSMLDHNLVERVSQLEDEIEA